jgi:PAS domain S-box-containing protein
MLVYFVRQRRDVPFKGIFWLFSAFITACGTTHLMEVWTLWHPTYWLSGTIKAITALVSLYTASELYPLIPQALSLPSPEQLEIANKALAEEIKERQQAEAEIRKLNAELEQRVKDRTAELEAVSLEAQNYAAKLVLALEIAQMGSWDWDMKANRADLTVQGRHIFDYNDTEEVTYESWKERVHPDDVERVEELVQKALNDIEDYKAQYRVIGSDGSVRWVDALGRFYYDAEGRPERMVGVVSDISDRKLAELALQESEERLNLAIEGARMATWDVELPTGKAIWSAGFFEILGYEAPPNGEATMEMWQSRVHPDDLPRVMQTIERAKGERSLYNPEYRIIRADNGQIVWLSSFGRFLYNEAGEAVRFIGICFDNTENKIAEAERRRNQERLQRLIETAQIGIAFARSTGEIVEANDALLQLLGYTREEFREQGLNWRAISPPEYAELDRQAMEELHQTGRVGPNEKALIRKDGDRVPILVSLVSLQDEEDEHVAFIVDLTERKQAERERQESAERLRMAQSAANAGWWDWDMVSDRVIWSEEYYALYGLDPAAVVPSYENWLASIVEEDRERAERELRRALEQRTEFNVEFRVQHPVRGMRWLIAIGRTAYNAQGQPVRMTGITLDITDRKQIEAALRESEERYRVLAENIPQMVWIARPDGFVEYFNQRWLDYTGLQPHETLGWDWQQVLHPDDRLLTQQQWTTSLATGNPYEVQYRLRRYDGEYRWHIGRGIPIRDDSGVITYWFGTCTDIDDRMRAEAVLHEKMAILNAINQATTTLIFAKDRQGRVLMANPATLRSMGMTENEVLGRTDLDFFADCEQAQQIMEHDRLVMESAQVAVFEEQLSLPEGKRTFLATKSPYRDERGNVIGMIGVATDITEHKQIQEKLTQQARLLELTYEAILVRNIDSRITYWNPSADELYGWKAEEALGQIPHVLLQTQCSPSCDDLDAILLQEGHWEGELIHTCQDGRQIVVESRQVLVRDDRGNPTGFLEVNRDITDRKRAEAMLRQSEERLRSFFEANIIGVLYGDVHGGIKEANDEFLRIVGYKREDLQSGRLRWVDITPSEYLPLDEERVAETKARGACTPYEKEYIRSDGSRVPVLVGYGLVGEEREESVAFILDLSDRKQAERELQESERRYATLAQLSPVGIFRCDCDGNCLYANERACEITGLSLKESLGSGWSSALHPGDRERVINEWKQAVEERQPFYSEYRFQRPDGTISWVLGQALPETEEDGQVISYVGTITDITDRKCAEIALQESERRYATLAQLSPVGIFRCDRDGNYLYVNERWCQIVGLSPEEGLGTGWKDALHRDDRERVINERKQAVEEHRPFYSNTVQLSLKVM